MRKLLLLALIAAAVTACTPVSQPQIVPCPPEFCIIVDVCPPDPSDFCIDF